MPEEKQEKTLEESLAELAEIREHADKFCVFLRVHFPNEVEEGKYVFDIATHIIEKLQSQKDIDEVTIRDLLQANKFQKDALAKMGVVLNPNAGVPNAIDFLEKK